MSAHPELRHVNDGGHDASLTPKSLRLYHWVIGGIIVVGFALLFLLR